MFGIVWDTNLDYDYGKKERKKGHNSRAYTFPKLCTSTCHRGSCVVNFVLMPWKL